MSKFDYMEFGYSAGDFDQLVFHAKKYNKEQVVEIFNNEYSYKGLIAKTDNVHEGYVKYFINPTDNMSSDFEGGCYGFVDKPGNGAFPVYMLELSELDYKELVFKVILSLLYSLNDREYHMFLSAQT